MARPHFQHQQLPLSPEEEDLLLARKDARSALVVWVCLEFLSFLVLPDFRLISGQDKISTWLSVSVPLGIAGSVLIGGSSWLLKRIQENVDKSHPNKRLMLISSQAVGWVGLVGVGLPMMMVGLELWFYMVNGID